LPTAAERNACIKRCWSSHCCACILHLMLVF
jgi:hypothetical protein